MYLQLWLNEAVKNMELYMNIITLTLQIMYSLGMLK